MKVHRKMKFAFAKYGLSVVLCRTCEIGVGAPPVDVVSKNVRMIIAVGFGIPAALIVIGGAYVAYLKLKKRRESRLVISETTTTTTNYQTLGPE